LYYKDLANPTLELLTFHVVQWATDTLVEVRLAAWREAKDAAKTGKTKRGSGRPKKGDEPAKANPVKEVKGARYHCQQVKPRGSKSML
jgi:transposase